MKLQFPPALRHRQFVIFWVGIVFGWIGRQALTWTIPWHIRSYTANPIALGAIGLIRFVPILVFSLPAGVLADMLNRRKIVFVTQSTMALSALFLAALTLTGKIQLWHIYFLVAVQTSAFVFDLPARYSMTPNTVPREDLHNALSVEFIAVQIGSLMGPILSGTLMDNFGQSSAYLVSAILIGMMLIALIVIGPVPQQKIKSVNTGIDWEAVKEGIRFTIKHPLIFPGLLLDFMATLLTRADSLMSYFAYDILGLSATKYGWLSAASAIGSFSASMTISQGGKVRYQGRLLLASIGMIGIATIVFGFSRSFPLSMAALIVVGASDSVSSIVRSMIRQEHTSDKLRGRMTSVNQIFFMGGPNLGDVKSLLANVIGIPLAVALGGATCIASVGWIARKWPALSTYDQSENQETESI